MVNSSGEWLDILLDDGRSFRFRPGAMINPDADIEARTDILNRLISIGIAQAVPATTDSGTTSSTATDSSSVTPHPATPDSATAHPATPNPAAPDSATPEAPTADDDLFSSIQIPSTPEEIINPPAGKSRSAQDPYIPTDTPGSESTLASEPVTPGDTSIVPIVRSAEYFLKSHNGGDSIVYIPLTDFVAVGLAKDYDDSIQPIYYSQLAGDMREVGEIMSEAVMNLREMANSKNSAIEMAAAQIKGARVLAFMQPPAYEVSWFCDLDMIHQVAEFITVNRPDDIPLFVPASRTKLYVVFADDPHIVEFFKMLLNNREDPDAVYPLPHTVATDGWREWIPMPGSELAEVLGSLRNHFRSTIYADQVNAMHSWQEFGALKPFIARRLKTGERVSTTEWDASDQHGSIPHTDFIVFTRSAGQRPGESQVPVSLTLRRRVAMEIWPEGFTKDEDAWPPRWNVTGFPDDETLHKLRDATNRRF